MFSNNIDMPSKWIEHVKDFAKSKGMSYRDALKSAECKSAYKSGSGLGGEIAEPKENVSMEIKEIVKRGRPKKYATPEEAKKAKSAKTIESNRRKREEKKGEGFNPAEKMVEYLEKAQTYAPAPIKRQIARNKEAIKTKLENTAKVIAEEKKAGRGGAVWKGATDPAFYKKYMEDKAKAEAEGKGIEDVISNKKYTDALKDIYGDLEKNTISKLNKVSKGKGILVAGYKTEADNGLTHIYPISHAHVLEILKHLA